MLLRRAGRVRVLGTAAQSRSRTNVPELCALCNVPQQSFRAFPKLLNTAEGGLMAWSKGWMGDSSWGRNPAQGRHHRGLAQATQGTKTASSLGMVGPTPPQVPVSGYGAGSSSGTPQDDMTKRPGLFHSNDAVQAGAPPLDGGRFLGQEIRLKAGITVAFGRPHKGRKRRLLLAWSGRPRPRSPYRGTGQALRRGLLRTTWLGGRALFS